MRFAIQYALTHPHRLDGGLPALPLTELGALHFREPDVDRFPCLRLARDAGECGGSMPAVLNAANEIAVGRFLRKDITFTGIWSLVERVMAAHDAIRDPALEDILAADGWARAAAEKAL
jgi:1-deoxy-D-xylulose-5-phosphate reductoisomerase